MIRPMMFVDEADVIGFQNKYDLPVVRSRCPIDGFTKRQYAKDLIRELNRDNPGVKQRMFTAILNGNIQGCAKSSSCQMILFIYIFLKTLAGVPFLDFHKLNDSLCGSVNTKDGTVKADIITVCG